MRYGLGLVIWSIMVVMDFFQLEEEDQSQNILFISALSGLFVFFMGVQMCLNLLRIASQAADGPFGQYKAGIGKTMEINERLQQKEKVKF